MISENTFLYQLRRKIIYIILFVRKIRFWRFIIKKSGGRLMTDSILDAMTEQYNSMTRSGKKLANYILSI